MTASDRDARAERSRLLDAAKKQIRQGTFLVALGLTTAALGVYVRAADTQQRDCLADSFAALTDSLEARVEIGDRDSQVKTRVIYRVARATSDAEVAAALSDFLVEQARVDRERDENPVPPFPSGVCDT